MWCRAEGQFAGSFFPKAREFALLGPSSICDGNGRLTEHFLEMKPKDVEESRIDKEGKGRLRRDTRPQSE